MENAEDALGGRLSGISLVDAAALPGYGRDPVGRAGRLARKSFKYVAVDSYQLRVGQHQRITYKLDHWT